MEIKIALNLSINRVSTGWNSSYCEIMDKFIIISISIRLCRPKAISSYWLIGFLTNDIQTIWNQRNVTSVEDYVRLLLTIKNFDKFEEKN